MHSTQKHLYSSSRNFKVLPFQQGIVEFPPKNTCLRPNQASPSLIPHRANPLTRSRVRLRAPLISTKSPLKPEKPFSINWCLIAATKHCLAIVWLPISSPIRPSVGNLTFICKVDDTAPMAWCQGLAKMVV